MMTKTREIIRDWTSRRWHTAHRWHAGTGKFIKRLLNRKIRHTKIDDY